MITSYQKQTKRPPFAEVKVTKFSGKDQSKIQIISLEVQALEVPDE